MVKLRKATLKLSFISVLFFMFFAQCELFAQCLNMNFTMESESLEDSHAHTKRNKYIRHTQGLPSLGTTQTYDKFATAYSVTAQGIHMC